VCTDMFDLQYTVYLFRFFVQRGAASLCDVSELALNKRVSEQPNQTIPSTFHSLIILYPVEI
jgi:hypothetical protein